MLQKTSIFKEIKYHRPWNKLQLKIAMQSLPS